MQYLPAESNTGMFGGNSNWRGPVWMPVNVLIVRALLNLYAFYGDDFKVECPTGSGQHMTLFEVAQEISRRLAQHLPARRRRPTAGLRRNEKFQDDPHWRDLILFYEYFHGDNGAGLGASHQTGWTGAGRAAARPVRARSTPRSVLETDVRSCGAARQGAGERRKRPARTSRSTKMPALRYPVAVPDQHPRLADGAVARRSAGARRSMTFPTPSWIARRDWASTGSGSSASGGRARRRSAISRANPEWRREFAETLPDLREDDIAGSGFAITGYTVHRDLGGDAALARLRERLAQRGLRLMLDFVPEPHGAWIIPGSRSIPSTSSHGTEDGSGARAAELHPGQTRAAAIWCSPTAAIRISPAGPTRCSSTTAIRPLQEAMIGELVQHRRAMRRRALRHGDAGPARRVRADLGHRAPLFWPKATAARARASPGLLLHGRGLLGSRMDDAAAGVRLRLRQAALRPPARGHARPVREHLHAGLDYQDKLARFLENHDEPRAAATFVRPYSEAAAVITYSVRPACVSFTRGSSRGRRKRISPHLVRAPGEPATARSRRSMTACSLLFGTLL